MKLNKGFTLVELIIVIAIMSIVAVILIPQLQSTKNSSKEKIDASSLENITIATKTTFENNKEYQQGLRLSNKASDHNIIMNYIVDSEGTVILKNCEINDINNIKCTNEGVEEINTEINNFKTMVENSINGQIEPINLKTEKYKSYDYKITINFPDVDLKVNVSMSKVKKK